MLRKMAQDASQEALKRSSDSPREEAIREAGKTTVLAQQHVESMAKEEFDKITQDGDDTEIERKSEMSPEKIKKLLVLFGVLAVVIGIIVALVLIPGKKPKSSSKAVDSNKKLTLGNPIVSDKTAPVDSKPTDSPSTTIESKPLTETPQTNPSKQNNNPLMASATSQTSAKNTVETPPSPVQGNPVSTETKTTGVVPNTKSASGVTQVSGAPVPAFESHVKTPVTNERSTETSTEELAIMTSELKKLKHEKQLLTKKLTETTKQLDELPKLRREIDQLKKKTADSVMIQKRTEAELSATKSAKIRKNTLQMLDSQTVEINSKVYRIGDKVQYGSTVYSIKKIDLVNGVYVEDAQGAMYQLKEK